MKPRIGFVVLALLLLLGSPARSQETTRTIGLSASIQTFQSVILVPIWISDRFIIAPGVGVDWTQNVDTDLVFALVPKFYTSMGRIAPYVSLLGGGMLNLPTGGGRVLDLIFGLAFGGDYFVNPKFSFGVEARVDAFVPDTGNINVSTGAAANVSIYLK